MVSEEQAEFVEQKNRVNMCYIFWFLNGNTALQYLLFENKPLNCSSCSVYIYESKSRIKRKKQSVLGSKVVERS